jgi:hypothetical protein
MQHSSRTRLALETKPKSLVRVKSAGTLPWLGLTEYSPTDRFSRGSIVESMYWMVLHRPVELAELTGHYVQIVINSASECLAWTTDAGRILREGIARSSTHNHRCQNWMPTRTRTLRGMIYGKDCTTRETWVRHNLPRRVRNHWGQPNATVRRSQAAERRSVRNT